MKNYLSCIWKNVRVLLVFIGLWGYHALQAQCDFATTAPIIINQTGAPYAGGTTLYLLVDDATGNVVGSTGVSPANFGTHAKGAYVAYAINYIGATPPSGITVGGLFAPSGNCFATTTHLVTVCDEIPAMDVCEGSDIVVVSNPDFRQGNGMIYVLVNTTTGNIVNMSPSGAAPATTFSAPSGGSPTQNYQVYAINYDAGTTLPPSLAIGQAWATAQADLAAIVAAGCADVSSALGYVTTAPVNAPPLFYNDSGLEDLVCNGGMSIDDFLPAPIPASNKCAPSLSNSGLRTTQAGNGGTASGGNMSIHTIACGAGTLDLENNPVVFQIECSSPVAGTNPLNVEISNPGGDITEIQAAIYGPIYPSSGCPNFAFGAAGASFVDCGADPNNLTLTVPDVHVGQKYLVIVDPIGQGTFNINITGSPFPLELLNFWGTSGNNRNLLYWETLFESNFSHFEVMRSLDNISFEKIGRVEGKGVNGERTQYNFIDEDAPMGVSYYQLNLVDIDGSVKLSNIVELMLSSDFSFSLYPNPAKNELNISFSGTSGKVQFFLSNAIGQNVSRHSWELDGQTLQTIDISHLAQGVYFYMIERKGMKYQGKIVKE